MPSEKLTFRMLVDSIRQIHNQLAGQAAKAVNISLTLRNWLIGMYISEFELRGADRATYGEKLLSELARQLTGLKISNCNRRQLYRYLRFHRAYPTIVGTLSPQLQSLIPSDLQVEKKVGTASPQLRAGLGKLLDSLSYSHFELLMDIDEPLKRTFYEIESMRGNWSVRELKRQIASLYYEHSDLSKNKGKLAKLAQSGAERPRTGRVRPRWHGQPDLCLQIRTRTAEEGRDPALPRRTTKRGSRLWGVNGRLRCTESWYSNRKKETNRGVPQGAGPHRRTFHRHSQGVESNGRKRLTRT